MEEQTYLEVPGDLEEVPTEEEHSSVVGFQGRLIIVLTSTRPSVVATFASPYDLATSVRPLVVVPSFRPLEEASYAA